MPTVLEYAVPLDISGGIPARAIAGTDDINQASSAGRVGLVSTALRAGQSSADGTAQNAVCSSISDHVRRMVVERHQLSVMKQRSAVDRAYCPLNALLLRLDLTWPMHPAAWSGTQLESEAWSGSAVRCPVLQALCADLVMLDTCYAAGMVAKASRAGKRACSGLAGANEADAAVAAAATVTAAAHRMLGCLRQPGRTDAALACALRLSSPSPMQLQQLPATLETQRPLLLRQKQRGKRPD